MFRISDYKKLIKSGIEAYTQHTTCPESGGKEDHKKRCWVKSNKAGTSFYCHHCGETAFFRSDTIGVNYKKKVLIGTNTVLEIDNVPNDFPEDFTNKLPKEALLWLFKYGITIEDLSIYNIGYSYSMARVIFPCYNSIGKISSWQGRSLDPNNHCKYLSGKGRKSVYCCSSQDWEQEYKVVLVEDCLSAIRVSKYIDTMALLGTRLNKVTKLAVVTNYTKVYVWLDKDAIDKARKISRAVGLFDTEVHVIETDLDPKCYSDDEIKKILG